MIVGLGTDLTEISRIEESHQKFGSKFLDRIFTPGEQKLAIDRHHIYPTLAKRFAAKEACAKALGVGFSKGVSWLDIEVTLTNNGQPCLNLSGTALDIAEKKAKPGKLTTHISLSDTDLHAMAVVIIESI